MGDCLITRRGGEVYKFPVLDVNYPEDVTTTVKRGYKTSATFAAVIAEPGSPAIYTYQWYVDGAAVEGATESVFKKDDLIITGTHTVYCEVTNKKGTVTTRIATLDVTQIYIPTLDDINPKDQTVARGTNVVCTVGFSEEGSPATYTYQWYKDGNPVEGETNSTYTLEMTGIGTASVYCEVTNSVGTVTTRTATIKEFYDIVPNTSVQWSTYKGSVGQTANYFAINLTGTNWEIAYASAEVDVTPYSVMHLTFSADYVDYENMEENRRFDYGLSDNVGGALIAGDTTERNAWARSFSVDKDYDISFLTETKYVTFRFYNEKGHSVATYAVTKIRFEA